MKAKAHLALQQLVLAAAMVAGIAACSSGSSTSGASSPPSTSSPATSAPASPPATATASGSATTSVIARNWEAFFNANTPTSRRVALLQDGQALEPVIKAQSGSGLAATATAKVTKVTMVSDTKATVIYSILVGGQTVLSNQKGVAVYQNGTWKVGLASFCGLLTLENNGNTSKLPTACKSAG